MRTWFVAWEIPKTTPTLNAVRWRRASLTLACITGHKHRPFLFQRISSNPIHQQSQKETMQHHKNRISLLSSGWGETKGGSLLSPALCYSLLSPWGNGKTLIMLPMWVLWEKSADHLPWTATAKLLYRRSCPRWVVGRLLDPGDERSISKCTSPPRSTSSLCIPVRCILMYLDAS